jgi:NADPH2:quinone reductase
MKAMLVKENEVMEWIEVSDPTISDDEALVEIHAVGVNRADILQRQGKYPSPAGCPPWMGLEISGVIKELGKVACEKTDLKVGDRVCALLGGGGYAEYVAVKYDMMIKLPDNLSFEHAAAIPEAFATSYLNLFTEAHLEAGDTVYISAGASGLATAMIPLAKAFGATVITSIIDETKREHVLTLGADIIVNTQKESLPEKFKELEEKGTPVKIAVDCLSGKTLGECMPYMARGGYWVVISTLDGVETNILLRPLLTKGLHLVGSMLRNRTPEMKARILSDLSQKVFPKIARGEMVPFVCRTLPIEQALSAHKLLEDGKSVGKVVLTVK